MQTVHSYFCRQLEDSKYREQIKKSKSVPALNVDSDTWQNLFFEVCSFPKTDQLPWVHDRINVLEKEALILVENELLSFVAGLFMLMACIHTKQYGVYAKQTFTRLRNHVRDSASRLP